MTKRTCCCVLDLPSDPAAVKDKPTNASIQLSAILCSFLPTLIRAERGSNIHAVVSTQQETFAT